MSHDVDVMHDFDHLYKQYVYTIVHVYLYTSMAMVHVHMQAYEYVRIRKISSVNHAC